MIYESVSVGEPIRQGDIFHRLPKIDISLAEIPFICPNDDRSDLELRAMSWDEAIDGDDGDEEGSEALLRAALPVTAITAIVITQDCDAARAEDISLCEIAALSKVFPNASTMVKPSRWVKALTRDDSGSQKWFYLPPDRTIGFSQRMGVDFMSIVRLPRPHLEMLSRLRIARLNQIAYEHFREKLAHFFRRYAFNPWYPLNAEEFSTYTSQAEENITPYPWQEGSE